MEFYTARQLTALCEEKGVSVGESMIQREMAMSGLEREAVLAEMGKNLSVMRESIKKGLQGEGKLHVEHPGAKRLHAYALHDPLCGAPLLRAAAASMAVVEVNASMGRIVAVPTAGASGIVPGVLITLGDARGWKEGQLVQALFCAAAVGYLIARNATISGADGGCQAETGSGAAMAAAALVELMGGAPGAAVEAAGMAIQNVMGLVCDPVAGLVESPCIKRNALGAANALLCADMALAGITSPIPFDETVEAMRRVGRALPANLRETALGGLAATPTGQKIASAAHGE